MFLVKTVTITESLKYLSLNAFPLVPPSPWINFFAFNLKKLLFDLNVILKSIDLIS